MFSVLSFLWGVGLAPGKEDVVKFRNLTNFDKESCVHVQLHHNVTYFSTVIAFNKALNQKSVNASSSGGREGTNFQHILSTSVLMIKINS